MERRVGHVEIAERFRGRRRFAALEGAFEDGAPDGDPAAIDAADTPDPWYGGPEDFAECLETVEACAPGVVEYVSRRLDAAS